MGSTLGSHFWSYAFYSVSDYIQARHSQSFDAFTVSQLAEIDDFVFGNLDRYKDEA